MTDANPSDRDESDPPASSGDPPVVDARPGDRERLPPGQTETEKWPVLHYGSMPPEERRRRESWTVEIRGGVRAAVTWSWEELMELPQRDVLCDIHCVTQWSRLDNRFTGIPLTAIARRVEILPECTHAMIHATDDWSANLPLEDLLREEVLLAHSHDGTPLTAEHGGPLRLVVPHLYFWKSAKWVTAIEFLTEDRPGFWERNGYHMRGDPWKEERFGW